MSNTEHDWPDIPDTPDQRKLIQDHNAAMREKHPSLKELGLFLPQKETLKLPINRKLLGPQRWREYPAFWLEAIKFRVELFVSRKRNKRDCR